MDEKQKKIDEKTLKIISRQRVGENMKFNYKRTAKK